MFKEDVLLTVNEEYKMKLWLLQPNQVKVCKKTCLGPSYGGPIAKMLNFTSFNNNSTVQQHYLAYSTKDKIVGLIKLPLEGNPNSTMGLIAHPGEITDIAASSDGKFLMTAGGNDFSVNIWEIQTEMLERLLLDE
jgi:WD40 repeat protein